jgi:phospholipase/carboxylesterase
VQDDILPIDRCGRPIARELRAAGYPVTMREFEGGHQMLESMIPLATSFAGWKES